jgi:ubiquinone/menaquinone biosynthesis C-methylase UbiE
MKYSEDAMLTTEQLDEVSAASKGGIIDKLGQRARANMHSKFFQVVNPDSDDTILDVGASANPAFIASNYLEWAYPTLKITALGLGEENPTWQKLYPSVPYIHGTALELPFEDNSFDVVYSHAVIEHVGSFDNQVKMISEAIRVARKSVWITTPYRWHPVEFHTVLPLIHWLPKPIHRYFLQKLGLNYFSTEETLNLLDRKSLNTAVQLAQPKKGQEAKIHISKFLGFSANLLLHIKK